MHRDQSWTTCLGRGAEARDRVYGGLWEELGLSVLKGALKRVSLLPERL